MEVIYPTHVLLVAEPYDWSTNYTSYYTKSGDNYVPVAGAAAPPWQSNTYYAEQTYTNPDLHRFSDDVPDNQDLRFSIYGTDSYRYVGIEDYYSLTTAKPDDWETNYTDYLYKDDEQYKYVSGTSAPTWVANTYYSCKEIP